MLVEAFLCFVSLLCLYFALRKPPALPPGVWGLPVFGKFPSQSKRFGDQVKELRPRYGDIITWRIGSRIMVFLCNYATIKRALSRKEFQDRPGYATYRVYCQGVQRGVIVGNGAKWLLHRRFMLHHLRNLGMGKSKAEDAIHEEAALMVQDFKKHTNEDKPLPMSLGVAVLNVIWKMVADTRFEPDDAKTYNFLHLFWEMNQAIQGGPVSVFNQLPWLEACAPTWLKRRWGLLKLQELTKKVNDFAKNIQQTYLPSSSTMKSFVKPLLQTTLSHRHFDWSTTRSLTSLTKSWRLRIIKPENFTPTKNSRDYVEQHKKTFDRLNIRDIIDEYLLAIEDNGGQSDYSLEDLYTLTTDLLEGGLETTTTTLRWAILYLTKFPEVQRRVQREIDDVVPRGTLPLYKDKAKLPYFNAVLSEVHRVVSLLPLTLPHQASVDTQLEGYAIPKGAILLPHAECCHKDPELWERPDEFYPEHFLDRDGKYVTREGFMPFSVGRRVCVGESLARVELYVFLVALLQSFTFSAPDGEELSTENDPAEVILNICKEYRVTIKERQ